MNHIENVGETILLDGQPLSLVTQAGVKHTIFPVAFPTFKQWLQSNHA